jgi:YfiH family protein
MDWQLRSADAIRWFELMGLPRLALWFFTRHRGISSPPFDSLNCSGSTGDEPGRVAANLRIAAEAARIERLALLRQVHSSTVVRLRTDCCSIETPTADACWTTDQGIGLAVRVADCLPVYIAARSGDCVGLAHCGWRGTAAQLARRLLDAMAGETGTAPSGFVFAAGPSICRDCYEVGDDVRSEFARSFPAGDRFFGAGRTSQPGRSYLDLRAANRWLLLEAGLCELPGIDLCTYEQPSLLFSARRGTPTGRNLALAALQP